LGYDREAIGKWYERLQREPHRHHFVVFAASVGFCGEVYYAVDREHRRAALDIKFVPEAQGKGLATDALKVLIRHVFETEKDVNVVWAEPSEANSAARQLYRRCGLEPAPRPADFGEGLYWMLSRETRREGDGGRGERR
jgi:RimJ/RimL family protein N-acetyltransferase